MGKLIDRWIADFVDRLKVSKPKTFIIIGAILAFLKAGFGENAIGSLHWILLQFGIDSSAYMVLGDSIDNWLLWLAALFVTTSTTAFLSNTERKETKIAKSKKISAALERAA